MTDATKRTFEDGVAVRGRLPLLIGLMGPSGGGKTFSALRLATGIQRVTGGDIFYIDTEARRALHYAERFHFRHVPFSPPFSPLDYLGAIQHCVSKKAGVVVVDSMSHEHEGPGGVLEMHDQLQQELAAKWKTSMENANMAAWKEPKGQRRRLINTVLQCPTNFIFCFRAKEKVKVATKKQRQAGEDSVQQLGFMPIAGEEFVFEMTVNCLLMPNAGGVPTWQSDERGERMMIKLPEQFREVFTDSVPLSEDIGEALARWAEGGGASRYETLTAEVAAATTEPHLVTTVWPSIERAKKGGLINDGEYAMLRDAFAARRKAVKNGTAAAPAPSTPPPAADTDTGEVASDAQISALNSLIDQVNEIEDGAGFSVLAEATGGATDLDEITTAQAARVESMLRQRLASAAA